MSALNDAAREAIEVGNLGHLVTCATTMSTPTHAKFYAPLRYGCEV